MKAMILAAGRGERMRPLTDHTPKPLLHVAGKPLIVWHIERLVAAGVQEIVINHAHLGAQIEHALGDGRAWGCQIFYSAETPPALETAGGIKKALPLLGDQPFLVINGDILTNYPLKNLMPHAQTQPSQALLHLVLIPNPEHNPAGDFCVINEYLCEKTTGQPSYTFSGIGLYHPDLFKDVPEQQAAKLAPLLKKACQSRQAHAEIYTGYWLDVGTPERLAQANQTANMQIST
jgi:MurNAc alpha-1-phosphate uridylyltransferase